MSHDPAHGTAVLSQPPAHLDYSLTGENAARAVERGLAEAEWNHSLARLHELIKDDCPPAYPSIAAAWREILPATLRQVKDPAYHVKRPLPAPKMRAPQNEPSQAKPDAVGRLKVCAAADLGPADVIRFDHGKKT